MMWEYMVTPGCRPEEVEHVAKQMQTDGWNLEHTHVRTLESIHEIRYDLMWKKPSKEISYGQMLINRAYDKLREVRDALGPLAHSKEPATAVGRITADIDKFLFDGSPEDM